MLAGKRVVITGGTGSLGKTLVRRLLTGEAGMPAKITVFSRDEAKQHEMRMYYKHVVAATDEIVYNNFSERLEFVIGDVRDYHRVATLLRSADVVFNAAALKQVPTCEYFPYEAVQTNISGPENIVRAIVQHRLPIETVVGISTDKACKPVNVMGMTKAIQERLFLSANILQPETRFICVRYGNVLASRGSVIPLFHDQIRNGGPVTITTESMTRFLLTLDDAVDTIFAAVRDGLPGETYIPRCPAARVTDIAKVLIGQRKVALKLVGIRPGEKEHEILISEEEVHRTIDRGKYYAIASVLPEIRKGATVESPLREEYSSGSAVVSYDKVVALIEQHRLRLEDAQDAGELLR